MKSIAVKFDGCSAIPGCSPGRADLRLVRIMAWFEEPHSGELAICSRGMQCSPAGPDATAGRLPLRPGGAGSRDGAWIMAAQSVGFAGEIAELKGVLLGTESVDDFLLGLAVLAARELGADLSCGIILQPRDRPPTVASSDVTAAQVDEVQYRLIGVRACARYGLASTSASMTWYSTGGGGNTPCGH